tara:strand:+ start:6405 stop:6572 length:168 start_codon:yes stop_codon:yes gene_type:complete
VLNSLRAQGLITETEVVYKEGDLFIAKDVVSNTRRIIEYRESVNETARGKRLLKG